MDDLVLFTKADQTNCLVIREVLHEFCSRFGQSVSGGKSRFIFPQMLEEKIGSLFVIYWVFNLLQILGSILVFL